MTWILTYPHGEHFHLSEPTPAKIHLEDIAHALGMQCRFAGHISQFYSIAQHSYLVSHLVPPRYAHIGLLHDATEAYLHDITRPLKALLPEYQALEEDTWRAMAKRFALPLDMPPEIKTADLVALATERAQLCSTDPEPWPCLKGVEPLTTPLPVWGPEKATERFLERAYELGIK